MLLLLTIVPLFSLGMTLIGLSQIEDEPLKEMILKYDETLQEFLPDRFFLPSELDVPELDYAKIRGYEGISLDDLQKLNHENLGGLSEHIRMNMDPLDHNCKHVNFQQELYGLNADANITDNPEYYNDKLDNLINEYGYNENLDALLVIPENSIAWTEHENILEVQDMIKSLDATNEHAASINGINHNITQRNSMRQILRNWCYLFFGLTTGTSVLSGIAFGCWKLWKDPSDNVHDIVPPKNAHKSTKNDSHETSSPGETFPVGKESNPTKASRARRRVLHNILDQI